MLNAEKTWKKRSSAAIWIALLAMGTLLAPAPAPGANEPSAKVRRDLAKYKGKCKILFETYRDNNWDIFMMDPDGSKQENLTKTPAIHEMYPHISSDGTKVCFSVDKGKGRDTIRSVYFMNLDGSGRTKVADFAREPSWTPGGNIAYCNQISKNTFKVIDYFTKGLVVYDLKTCEHVPIPSSDRVEHLYNQNFAPNGKWIASTVHAGMGYDHANLLIEAEGNQIILTDAEGCRPRISPDGKRIAWGRTDHELQIAEVDLDSDEPKLRNIRPVVIINKYEKVYHVDWSPDSKYLTFSRGPEGKGVAGLPGTHFGSANEIIGIYAKNWDIWTVPTPLPGSVIDLNSPEGKALAVNLTQNGSSNKEPEWYVLKE